MQYPPPKIDFPAPTASPPPALLLALLDEIDIAIWICDEAGNIGFANTLARRELHQGRWLRAEGDRVACSDDTAARGALSRALQQACRSDRRQILRLSSGGERLCLSVGPLVVAAGQPVHALLMLGRRSPCSRLSLELLGMQSGMTPAERRVLWGVASQQTPAQLARSYGTRLSTVRTQLSSVRAKLGVSSIKNLLSVTGGLPPVALALRAVGADNNIGQVAEANTNALPAAVPQAVHPMSASAKIMHAIALPT